MKKTEAELKAELYELQSKRRDVNNRISAIKKQLKMQTNNELHIY